MQRWRTCLSHRGCETMLAQPAETKTAAAECRQHQMSQKRYPGQWPCRWSSWWYCCHHPALGQVAHQPAGHHLHTQRMHEKMELGYAAKSAQTPSNEKVELGYAAKYSQTSIQTPTHEKMQLGCAAKSTQTPIQTPTHEKMKWWKNEIRKCCKICSTQTQYKHPNTKRWNQDVLRNLHKHPYKHQHIKNWLNAIKIDSCQTNLKIEHKNAKIYKHYIYI